MKACIKIASENIFLIGILQLIICPRKFGKTTVRGLGSVLINFNSRLFIAVLNYYVIFSTDARTMRRSSFSLKPLF